MIVTSNARAYVNFGRWIADCPLGCGGAQQLEPNQTSFFCSPPAGCGHMSTVEWPSSPDSIWDALMERPMPKTRNWFPEDHELAIRANCPHGQTAKQLREEASENEVK